jgi:hypothetical protein
LVNAKYIGFLIGFLWVAASVSAQSLTASVSNSKIGKSEQFRLVFEADGQTRDFQPPNLSEFEIKGGPFPSEQTTIINGRMSFSISYTYVLQPREVGTFTIGSAVAEVDGNVVKSNPLQIEVVRDEDRPRDPNDPYTIATKATFIKMNVSKSNVYVGEPIVVSYKLYYRYNISDYSVEMPELSGFYKTELEVENQRNNTEVVNGVQYNVATLKSYMLIPQKSGELAIDPLTMEAAVSVPTRQRDFFGRVVMRSVRVELKPPTKVLNIRALPPAPDGFTGAVGNFTIDLDLSDTVVSGDEGVDLNISVVGNGNITLFDLPEPEIPSYFEVFDPQYKERVKSNSTGIRGEVSKKYLLISRYKGDYKIPAIRWVYFDPSKEAYRELSTEQVTIRVTTGAEASGTSTVNNTPNSIVGKEPVRLLNRDILYIKPRFGALRINHEKGWNWVWLLVLWVMPALIFGWLGTRWVEKKNALPLADKKRKKARKIALKRLKEARIALKNQSDEFYEVLLKSVDSYLGDKVGISRSEMSEDSIAEILSQKRVDQREIQQLLTVIKRCEFARYAPNGSESDQRELIDQAENVILKMEETI